MDEFKSQIDNWVQIANGVVDYDKVIEEFLKDLGHRNVPELIVDKTPNQPKKKRNVLSAINASTNADIDESTGKKSLTKKSLDPILREAENDVSQQKINERPSRVAKGKAIGNLKEPSLATKMRNDNDVKKERISNFNNSVNQTGMSINLTEHTGDSSDKSEARMEVGIPDQSEPEATEIRHSNNKKVKLTSQSQENTSIEIVPTPEIKIELVSDEEKEKMPPPSQPPPKTKKKIKAASKSSNSSNIGEIIPASEIKQESSESASIISASNNNTRLKRTKGKKKRNISESESSKSQMNSGDDEVDGDRNPVKKPEVKKSDEATKEAVPIPTLNVTLESVYEDAISDNAKKLDTSATNVQEVKNCSVKLTKMSALDINSIKSSGIEILENENLNNVTFNMNVTRTVDPGETFVTEKEQANSTFVVPLAQANGTIIIDKKQNENGLQSSLITDDESETDESYKQKYESIKQKSKNMGKNEIFNPLIQSPVRKKVQAFEKHAAMNLNAFGSPSGTRVTRIKSRVQDIKENRDTNTPVSRIPKPETPGTDPKTHRYLTPKEMTSTSLVNHNLKKKFNSTSKLQGLGSNGGLSSKSSTSRENSVEDLKRGASLLQLAAEEKKRKREEKQKHAQQIREAKDREKRETAERVAREKQEKSKKLLQEKEEKARQEFEKKKIIREHKFQKIDRQKNLEEIKKNLQIPHEIEHKRDEQMVYELQKKKLAEPKERDLLDLARMNAMRDEINRDLSYHVQETSTASKQASKKKQYDFDLLLSGDSTDEEDKHTTKKPPPPTWSLSKVRQPVIREQNYIQWKIVDELFSVQPMTIDLQEIFPTIESRYLKRNSSVIWSTPPRYSELPKY